LRAALRQRAADPGHGRAGGDRQTVHECSS
jgi:hypothetical protein